MSKETSNEEKTEQLSNSEKTNDDKKQVQGNGAGDPDSPNDIDIDNTDDIRKIFVGGLNWETTEKDLKEYFNKFGAVRTCTIKMDKFTGHSRGFGFVIFEEEETVNKVLATKEHKLNNKLIDPKRAKPNREPLKKIFVGGLDPDVTESQIRDYFSQFGKIESLDLPFDSQKNKRKAYIFVCFSSEAEAKKATKQEKQEISGKQCDVRIAVPKEQASRQRLWNKNNWHMMHYPFYPGYYGNFDFPNFSGAPYDYHSYPPGPYFGGPYGYDYMNYGANYMGFARGGGRVRGGGRGSGGPSNNINNPSAAPTASGGSGAPSGGPNGQL